MPRVLVWHLKCVPPSDQSVTGVSAIKDTPATELIVKVSWWLKSWPSTIYHLFLVYSMFRVIDFSHVDQMLFYDFAVTVLYCRTQVRFWFSTVCNFLFVIQMFRERLNRFAPNWKGRRVCPPCGRVWMSRSKVKVIREKRKSDESSSLTMHSKAVRCTQQTTPLRRSRGVTAADADGGLHAVYAW